MTTIQNVHAQKMLEGLGGTAITVKELAEHTSKNGILVKAHIGRKTGYLPLPQEALGVSKKELTEATQGFMDASVSSGNIKYLPTGYLRDLNKTEGRVRKYILNKCLTHIFMTKGTYMEMRAEFQEARAAYFALRDEICGEWDTLMENFAENLEGMLQDMQLEPQQKETVAKKIMAGIPTQNEFYASFYMDLEVTAFPAGNGAVLGMEDSIVADIDATWQNEVITNAVVAMETLICEAWDRLNKAYKFHSKHDILRSTQVDALIALGKRIRLSNIFENPLIKELGVRFQDIKKAMPVSEIIEICESAILDIYQYAEYVGFGLDMECSALSKETIQQMIKLNQSLNNYQNAAGM